MERRRFVLGDFHGVAVHLRRARLVVPHLPAAVLLVLTHGLKELERPKGADVYRVDRLIKAHTHMALGAEVVHLVGCDLAQRHRQRAGVGKVAVVKLQPRPRLVRVLVDVIEPVGVEARRAPDDAVDVVALSQEQLREVAAVLAGDPRDKRASHVRHDRLRESA